jgi:ABC-2 type transport system permease protein
MNPTIARITARGLLGRRRFLLLLVLPALLVGLTVLVKFAAVDNSEGEWAPTVLGGLGFNVVLPIIALIVGTGVLGSEIDDGTLAHVLAKPLPRWEIIVTKLVVAVVTTVAVVVPAMFAAGTVVGGAKLGVGLAVGSAVSSVAYSAVFVAISLLSARPVLVGLAYILLWEGMLTGFISGTAVLSVTQYGVAIADSVAGTDLITGRLNVAVAAILAAVAAVGATVLAIDRLKSYRLAGETG